MEDDGPYQSESEFGIAVDDVLRLYVDQFDVFALQKSQRYPDVIQHVKAHTPGRFPRLKIFFKWNSFSLTWKREKNVSIIR